MSSRRSLIASLGLSGAIVAANQNRSRAQTSPSPQIDRIASDLHDAIRGFEVDDTHCHAATAAYSQLTPREFLLVLRLPEKIL